MSTQSSVATGPLFAGLLFAGLLSAGNAFAGPPDAETASAAGAAPETLRFVACPVYRDTDAGRKSGCWLADNPEDGLRYDVTRSPTKPDWNRAILVEGRVAAGHADTCGGIVLEPVRVSLLAEGCTRAMLPAETHPGIPFVLPARNVRPIHEARELPVAPFATRSFHVPFDHGSDFIVYQLGDYYTNQAVLYARDTQARRIEITGWAATTPVTVSGRTLAEPAALARSRADMIAQWLVMSGIEARRIVVKASPVDQAADIEGADGLRDSSRRRVDIVVIP